MFNDLDISIQDHIGIITLNRPNALNALTYPMIVNLQKQLQAWSKDSEIHAVVIKSNHPKAFCAGGDVRWLYEAGEGNHHEQMQFFWHEYRLNHYIANYSKPFIALLNGMTMGGGVGVSLHGRYPILTDKFSFAMPETGIGFFPDIGASFLLSRMPHQLGLYLGLTGNRIGIDDALVAKLSPYAIHSDMILNFEQALYHEDNFEIDALEALIKQFRYQPKESLLPLENISHCFSADDLESILDRLKHLDNDWANETLKILNQKSPKSLKITFTQLQRAKEMTLAQCLYMDYALVSHFMLDHDFYEGVRALLVDKDKMPRWQDKSISQVSPVELNKYFTVGSEPLEFLLST